MDSHPVKVFPCMVCGVAGKFRVGINRVPLCGTHHNELKRKAGFGVFGYTSGLTRPEIRRVFGFVIEDDRDYLEADGVTEKAKGGA